MEGIERPYTKRPVKQTNETIRDSSSMATVLRAESTYYPVNVAGIQRKKHIERNASKSWTFRPSKRIIRVGTSASKKHAARPHKRIIKPDYKSSKKTLGGLRTFDKAYTTNDEEISFARQIGGQKRRVLDAEGYPCALRPPVDFDLEKEMGGKRAVPYLEQRRNGIPCRRPGDRLVNAAEYIDGFYKNHLHGGGYLPGSNFGFARATQTTVDGKRVFGKGLGELWKRSLGVPAVITMCLDYLQQPTVLRVRNLYSIVRAAADEEDEENVMSSRAFENGDADAASIPSVVSEYDLIKKEVKALRRRFDKGQDRTIDLSTVSSPKVVSTLLHQYFQEMSPPLFTYRLYVKMMGTQRHESPDARLDALKPAISSLPGPNQTVLKLIVKYFAALLDETNTAENGLSASALSQIFGPLFLRRDPRKPRLDAFSNDELEKSLAIRVLECLLENRTKLFSESVLELNRQRHRIPLAYKNAIKELLGAIDSVANLKEWEKKAGVFPEDDSDDESIPGLAAGADIAAGGASKNLEGVEKKLDEIMNGIEQKLLET